MMLPFFMITSEDREVPVSVEMLPPLNAASPFSTVE